MSVVNIAKEALPTFLAGNSTVGTTPQQLSDIPFEVLKHIVVRSNADNGSTITVGPSSAQASNGFVLAAGEQTPPIYVDNLNKIWVVGGDADQAYQWVAS